MFIFEKNLRGKELEFSYYNYFNSCFMYVFSKLCGICNITICRMFYFIVLLYSDNLSLIFYVKYYIFAPLHIAYTKEILEKHLKHQEYNTQNLNQKLIHNLT